MTWISTLSSAVVAGSCLWLYWRERRRNRALRALLAPQGSSVHLTYGAGAPRSPHPFAAAVTLRGSMVRLAALERQELSTGVTIGTCPTCALTLVIAEE